MTTYDLRGNVIRFDREVTPDDLLAVYDEQDAADFAYEEASDNVFVLERKVRAAKEQDVADLRAVLDAGKEPPKMIDKAEREALAAVVRAKVVRDAKGRIAAEAREKVARAVRARLPEIEAIAADKAHRLGEEYRAALQKVARLREPYVSTLESWANVRAERHRLAGDDHWHWNPSSGGSILFGNEPASLLQGLIDEDAARHIPKPRRFVASETQSADAARREWESNARNGVRMDGDTLQPVTSPGFKSIDARSPRRVVRAV